MSDLVPIEPRKVRFSSVEGDDLRCSCCYGHAPIAVRVESASAAAVEQRDAMDGPVMCGHSVERSQTGGFVLICAVCLSSMTAALREVVS